MRAQTTVLEAGGRYWVQGLGPEILGIGSLSPKASALLCCFRRVANSHSISTVLHLPIYYPPS